MCGFAGLFEPEGDPRRRDRLVEAMAGAMVHRGPDDVGFFSDDTVGLGFRRLSVIDLITGAQPIRLEDDRAVIVLNGEIYNYRELRRELEGRQRFRSRGDVEVVLRLYAELGIAALERLNGMFALALWDRRKRTLFLARDRQGIKPLFYCQDGTALAFASEFSALLAAGFPARKTLDPLQIRHYLFQKYLAPDRSILKEVRQLAPGTVLEIGPAGTREFRYWTPAAEPSVRDPREATARIAELLPTAVKRQLVADVPVGVFLSGGLDSGTLTALVRDAGADPVRTFSVGFTGPGAVSELPAAQETAQRLGTEHHELVMDAAEVAADLPAILAHLDGPLGDATALPTWYMCRLARQAVTVALSGEGADELFGGYARQRFDAWMDRLGGAGRRLLPLALRLAGRPVSPRLAHRVRMEPSLARQLDWSRVFTAEEIENLAASSLPSEEEILAGLHAFEARWTARARRDPLGARLETDRELFLPGDLLPKVDRMSMAHSLEVRVPFLDDDLVDFVVPLPGRLKVRPGRDKALLRDVADRRLPPAARRTKQGFTVPIGAWLRGPLRQALLDFLDETTVKRRGLFHPAEVNRMVKTHLSGTEDLGEPLWLLLVLEGWMQEVLDRAPETVP